MPIGVYDRNNKASDDELKARRRKRQQNPEYKAMEKAKRDTPEMKLKRKKHNQSDKVKAYDKARNQTRERKESQKSNRKKPENIKKRKERTSTPEYKAMEKAKRDTPEWRAERRRYKQTTEVKEKQKEYDSRPTSILRRRKWSETPEVMKKAKEVRASNTLVRLNILSGYSKRLSNSTVPCCNCCGLNSHLDFLEIDHIAGKKQMDSIPELVAIGYSSELKHQKLRNWIIKNNFPDGFQILCHNCNMGKGMKKNNNKCPHEK
jgi:hypothetical protein